MATRKNPSKGAKPDKIMRDALSIELHREQEADIDGQKQKVKRYRLVADALVKKAIDGDTAAIKEIHDRMDGKVPQAIVGDDDHPPVIAHYSDEERARALEVFLAKGKFASA